MENECTLVRWDVVNVREVYYENLPVNGQGEREECIDDHNEVYTLKVLLPTGVTEVYTTAVTYMAPTPTPTITPSFTPEPVFTPTWTPLPPTPTPTPDVTYATNLRINGSADLTCNAGATCEVGLLVSNGGSDIDNLAISVSCRGNIPRATLSS